MNSERSSVSGRDNNPNRQRRPSLALWVGVTAAEICTQKGKSQSEDRDAAVRIRGAAALMIFCVLAGLAHGEAPKATDPLQGTAVKAELASPAKASGKCPQRFGSVIGLRPEKLGEYKKLHAAVWPEVVKAVREANVRNYSIYLRKLPDGNYYLFSYMEYVGDDFKGDMARLAADANVKRWWKLTDPCQKPLDDRKEGEWWGSMEEVCHQD